MNTLTVVGSVYFQSTGEQPSQLDNRYERRLSEDEQPYMRTMKVSEGWVLLDCGWVKEASLVLLENLEGNNPQRVMSSEEKNEMSLRVIQLGVKLNVDGGEVIPLIVVRPGEACQFEPDDLQGLWVRCRSGVGKFSIAVFPR